MLDFVDETFHQIPLAIEPSIVFSLLFGTRMRWDHHFYASFKQAVHKFLRGIAPIRDNSLKGKAFHQVPGLIDVVSLTRTQAEAQGIDQSINRDMYLAAKPPRLRPKACSSLFWAPTQLMRELGYGQGYQAYTTRACCRRRSKASVIFVTMRSSCKGCKTT